MAAALHCLECQEPVPPGSPVALCGGCLIRLAEEARQEETLAQGKRHGTSLPRRFGDYQLLEQVGIPAAAARRFSTSPEKRSRASA